MYKLSSALQRMRLPCNILGNVRYLVLSTLLAGYTICCLPQVNIGLTFIKLRCVEARKMYTAEK